MKIGIATYPFKQSVERLFEQEVEVVIPSDIKSYDLIVFSGGADISPELYGQANTHSYINPDRDKIEVEVFIRARGAGIPLFGICRGHQFLNALKGGQLVQDLRYFKKDHNGYHDLRIIEKESAIGKIYSEVNSLHHQGVESAGKGLKVTSVHKGVIESTEGKDIISVQWHPEFMLDKQAMLLAEYIKEWAIKE